MIRLTSEDRKAVERAADILEAQGYEAFLALIERSKAQHEARKG